MISGLTGSTVNTRQRRPRWPAVLLPVAMLGFAACGTTGPDEQPQKGASGAISSATQEPAMTSGPSHPRSATGSETPEAAAESWVTQILGGHYAEACLASAPVASPGEDPEALCSSPDVLKTGESLREAWAKPGVKLPPQGKVDVTGVTGEGDKVTVQDTAITLDGRTLRSLALIGSSGDTTSFSLTLDVQKLDGSWYVGNLNLNI